MQKELLSSSKYYLSQPFWRLLRSVLSGNLWGKMYSVRQRMLLQKLEAKLSLAMSLTGSMSDGRVWDKSLTSRRLGNVHPLSGESAVLEKLFNHYETDKCTLHNYQYLYASFFHEHKNDVKNLLEIGIYKGGSLRAWREYFERGNIYGMDIDPNTIFQGERIQTIVADQNKIESLASAFKEFGVKFDVIVDDGWHQPEASVNTMIAALPYMSENSVFVLEDIKGNLYEPFFSRLAQTINVYKDFSAEYIDLNKTVQRFGTKDSCVFVIKKCVAPAE